ncbi:PilW family protein [Leptolyngbya sp. KIOST-1]|uniref:PilW family protein n=1 Tax=Leptolyngbya sp. KIOST-1 TaxID=1229172 RepID=UPI00056CB19E|nr:prepilin-type N-terminal cleavage/methylation domain-containing protein [Leptolyngbya sp. KIOST-1]
MGRRGFTLIELLVAIAVGSLIVGTMLFLVVELLRINRREEILTQTQQDMRRAIDYITRDAGEAVFIYSTPAEVVGQLNDFPRAGEVPVLAFWRLDPLDPTNANVRTFFNTACSATFTGARLNECNTLRLRQGYYTLVVYAQQQNTGNDIWGGRSRIIRYELPKYTAGGLANLNITPGYAEPTGTTNNFANWTSAGNTPRNISVLTDFVDNTDANQATTGLCPDGYLQTPANANNFYACVLEGTTRANPNDAALTTGSNQTLIVFLRGNADTQNSALGSFSQAGALPTLRSEVLIRGVLDKQPGL